jgi:hypothetical protein
MSCRNGDRDWLFGLLFCSFGAGRFDCAALSCSGEARRLYYKTPGPSLERMKTLAFITLLAKSSERKCSYFLIAMTFAQTGCPVKQVISRCTRVTASLMENGYLPGKSGDDVS